MIDGGNRPIDLFQIFGEQFIRRNLGQCQREIILTNIEDFFKRLSVKPEDLDGILLLLASERSNFINGAVIAADDGFGV